MPISHQVRFVATYTLQIEDWSPVQFSSGSVLPERMDEVIFYFFLFFFVFGNIIKQVLSPTLDTVMGVARLA